MIMIVISLSLLGGFLFLSENLQDEAAEEFGIAIMQNILAGVNKNAAEVRVFAEISESSNVTKDMRIPTLIGDKDYYIYGRKNLTAVKVVGEDWVIAEPLYGWANQSVRGLVYGGQGDLELSWTSTSRQNVSIS
jgi:hypothetical protein